MNAAWIWVQFFACLAAILIAGSRLARYGDLLGRKTGLGRVWIGVVVLAAVTSLPELATAVSSVTFIRQPNLSMGDLFGANIVNLMIIAVIDVYYRQGHVLFLLGSGIVLTAALGVMMIAAVTVFIYLSQSGLTLVLFGRVGIFTVILFVLYLFSQYMIFRFKPPDGEKVAAVSLVKESGSSSRRLGFYFLAAALVTAGAGVWLAEIGRSIAGITGLSTSFVGTLFLAACTSAPELSVSISAAKLGALDMSIGNLVGSNLFNMGVIIFVADLFYKPGSILQGVDSIHIMTALFAILMSSIIIISIIFRPRMWLKAWMGVDTVVIAVIYLAAIISLYILSGSR
jgi:cation:H+ antiporter